jgi:tRNA-binding protein
LTVVATFEDFKQLDIRIGVVTEALPFTGGKSSTHILMVDFGPELGVKKSLAKLAPNYDGPALVGRQVLCVVNFPPRQIGQHLSEVLTLGVPDGQGDVVLIGPERDVPLGGRLY